MTFLEGGVALDRRGVRALNEDEAWVWMNDYEL